MKRETHIGSKWAGEPSDTPEQLLEMLAKEPLDRSFERYSSFCYRPFHDDGKRKPLYPDNPNIRTFFGNFFRVSYVFNLDTDDADLIRRLRRAIRANQKRADYLSQDKPKGGK